MPYATVDDLTLYYEEHGPPDGPPLVLLHEFDESGATTWAAQLPALGARYRLVVPDSRGRGRTDNPGSPAAMTHRRFARRATARASAHARTARQRSGGGRRPRPPGVLQDAVRRTRRSSGLRLAAGPPSG